MYSALTTQAELWSTVGKCIPKLRFHASSREELTDDALRTFLAIERDESTRTVLSLVLETVQRAERRCPFSGGATLRALLGHLENLQRLSPGEQLIAARDIRSAARDKANNIAARSRVPSRAEIGALLEKYVTSSRLRKVVKTIVDRGGLDGRYTVDVGKTADIVVESTLGYNFQVICPIRTEKWQRRDVKCLIIDGVIEQVHEIHHALDRAATGKFPLVIVARRLGDDILTTLKVNNQRGTLDVLPLLVPMEVESLNTLGDLAAVFGCEVVSSMKGQIVSSVDLADSPNVDAISFSNGMLTVENRRTALAVEIHRAGVAAKSDVVVPDLRKFYDARVKSLSPNHTLVMLPKTYDSLSVSSDAQTISSGMKLIKAAHELGVYGDGELSLRSVTAELHAAQQAEMIASIGCLIMKSK